MILIGCESKSDETGHPSAEWNALNNSGIIQRKVGPLGHRRALKK